MKKRLQNTLAGLAAAGIVTASSVAYAAGGMAFGGRGGSGFRLAPRLNMSRTANQPTYNNKVASGSAAIKTESLKPSNPAPATPNQLTTTSQSPVVNGGKPPLGATGNPVAGSGSASTGTGISAGPAGLSGINTVGGLPHGPNAGPINPIGPIKPTGPNAPIKPINPIKPIQPTNPPASGTGVGTIGGSGGGTSIPPTTPTSPTTPTRFGGFGFPFLFPFGGFGGGFGGGSGSGGYGNGGVAQAGPAVSQAAPVEQADPQSAPSEQAAPAFQQVNYAAAAPASAQKVDLELLEVRQIDAGDAQHGPAYRVTVRNKSAVDVTEAFDVTLYGSTSRQLTAEAPQATGLVQGISANQVLTTDVRLPVQANNMGRNVAGQPVSFVWLTASVDAEEQVQDASRNNNVVTLNRVDIPMVAGN